MTTPNDTPVAGTVNDEATAEVARNVNFVELTRDDIIHMLRFKGLTVADDATLDLGVFSNGAAQPVYNSEIAGGNMIRLGLRAAA